ncbi:MAG: outer membrane protein assembly factor BamE [Halomonadaceae bacterium]|nr:MAG: outer membrane protein assembly factor BamE [Halomonadaceae bacterium]
MQKLSRQLCLILLSLTLAGCFPGVFKINVQQGNIVDTEDLELLNPTMTRNDVHELLGTPLTRSTINPNREHYLYTFQRAGGDIERQRITIYYEDDRYLRHSANLLPETPAN